MGLGRNVDSLLLHAKKNDKKKIEEL